MTVAVDTAVNLVQNVRCPYEDATVGCAVGLILYTLL